MSRLVLKVSKRKRLQYATGRVQGCNAGVVQAGFSAGKNRKKMPETVLTQQTSGSWIVLNTLRQILVGQRSVVLIMTMVAIDLTTDFATLPGCAMNVYVSRSSTHGVN